MCCGWKLGSWLTGLNFNPLSTSLLVQDGRANSHNITAQNGDTTTEIIKPLSHLLAGIGNLSEGVFPDWFSVVLFGFQLLQAFVNGRKASSHLLKNGLQGWLCGVFAHGYIFGPVDLNCQ